MSVIHLFLWCLRGTFIANPAVCMTVMALSDTPSTTLEQTIFSSWWLPNTNYWSCFRVSDFRDADPPKDWPIDLFKVSFILYQITIKLPFGRICSTVSISKHRTSKSKLTFILFWWVIGYILGPAKPCKEWVNTLFILDGGNPYEPWWSTGFSSV